MINETAPGGFVLARHVRQTAPGTVEALVLAGDSPEVLNDTDHPNRVIPEKTSLADRQGTVELPPHSLTILKVPPPETN